MKICPTCKKTYTDETLNFCLEDGAVLNALTNDESSQPTIFMGQPPATSPNAANVSPTSGDPTLPQINRGITGAVPSRPVKKSNAWVWVLGIVALVVIIGGVGFIGIVALIATNIESDNTNKTITDESNTRRDPVEKSETPITFNTTEKDNFSTWRVEKNEYGSTEYRAGEYIMSSKRANYYYVLVTANSEFDTYDASTKITVRNVNGSPTNSGYGILIHSDIKSPLIRDYGFLIDSAKQSYRVVQHANLKESVLVQWTRLPAIRSGTQTNELEVRDSNGKMSFYVNGQFATTVEDSNKFKDGVYGLYVSDAIPIAFSNLQIGK